jgi:ligand-binding sensor domain-containing protein
MVSIFSVGLFLLSLGFLSSVGTAQSLKPGEWQTYTSMRAVTDIAISSDSEYVWAATGGGVFRADLRNVQTPLLPLRTTDGLTENDVDAIAADDRGNIYIGEGLGGFDIYNIPTGTFNNQTDIRNQGYSNAAINGITVFRDTVYLATGYGITVFLPQEGLSGIFDATATQLNTLPQQDSVRQVIDDGTYVYAAMHEGVVWASNSSDLHVSSNWSFIPDSGGSVRALADVNGTIYAGALNGLFVISPERSSLVAVPLQDSLGIDRLLVANDSLYILDNAGVLYSTQDMIHLASRNISSQAGGTATAIAFSATDGMIAGTAYAGIGYAVGGSFNGTIFPPGPIVSSINFLSFATATDQLYVTNLNAGFGVFQPATDAWQDYQGGVGTTPTADYYKVLYDSVRDLTWLSTIGYPLYNVAGLGTSNPIWNADSQTQIPDYNGTDGSFIVTSGMMLDANNNFVVTDWAGNGRGLCISSDGKNFTDYPLSNAIEPWGCVTQDMNGNYWVGTEEHNAPASQGVYWYNPSTQSFNVINGGSSGTLGPAIEGTQDVNAVLTDQDDGIWCGTEGGVEIISNPEAIMQPEPQFSIRSVQFITNQIVHCMAVDGVGNKWVGTDNGIFVVSPDGSDSVAHYTAENSPLVNDQVNSIAIDPTRGETYAGTPAGISRFSTIFKQGQPDYTGIRVYPNPVVQTAEGTPSGSPTVYIDGLVAGSTVQIFSLAGRLITTIDGTQLGSTVTWNGRDALGRQVPSGMYLISATSPQAGTNGEAKVVIVRKPG